LIWQWTAMQRPSSSVWERNISLDLENLRGFQDALQAIETILRAVAEGEITPSEGQAVASLVETHRRTFEVEEHRSLGSTAVRRTLKSRLARLEKKSVSPKFEVLWVDVDSGETHEGALKARYGDQIPPDVEPITVSWKLQKILNR
jgi:hypothetical protein